jgi:hypothetical protein
MKLRKAVALLLTVSVVGSVAGCSKVKKVTQEDFISACEAMGAEEVDPDDFSTLDDSDYGDGVYSILDHDYIEENLTSDTEDLSTNTMGMTAPDFTEIIDPDDIEEMVAFVLEEQNVSDVEDVGDVEDVDVNAVVACHMTLSSADMTEELMGNLADFLDEYDIDVEELSSNEYYVGKNEAYLMVNVDAEMLKSAFLESDTYDLLTQFSEEDIESAIEGLSGSVCVGFYINGENAVLVIGAFVNNEPDSLSDFVSDLGLTDPSTLPSNEMVAEAIIGYVDDTVGTMLSMFASMMAAYS